MAGMSLLRPVLQRTFRAGFKLNGQNGVLSMPKLQAIPVRSMAGKEKILRQPTRMEWETFKDDVVFWHVIWMIPCVAAMGYANFVVGQAVLSDIPEGYEPEPYEYHKGPIQRWFSKYVYDSLEYSYHKKMVENIEEADKLRLRKLDRKVRSLMKDNQDYKSWYFYPGSLEETIKARQTEDLHFHGDNTMYVK